MTVGLGLDSAEAYCDSVFHLDPCPSFDMLLILFLKAALIAGAGFLAGCLYAMTNTAVARARREAA